MWPLTPYSPQTHCNSLVNVGTAGKLVYLVKWGHLVKLEASESASMPSEAGMRRALQKNGDRLVMGASKNLGSGALCTGTKYALIPLLRCHFPCKSPQPSHLSPHIVLLVSGKDRLWT